MRELKGLISWSIVLISFPYVLSNDVVVKGPDQILTGDYEKFTCDVTGNDVVSNYGLEWKFELKNGQIIDLDETDMISTLEVRKHSRSSDNQTYHLSVTSFIRMDSSDVKSIKCQHSPSISDSMDVEVMDLPTLTTDNDPCEKANKEGKPIVSVHLPPIDLIMPSYRRSHYVNDRFLKLEYGRDVTEVKLECYGISSETENDNFPKWSINRDFATKMRFAAWAQESACRKQILHIYQVAGEPGHVTNLTMVCSSGSATSTINLGFQFSPAKGGAGKLDMNATENCIDQVVEQFYNKELTGVGVGSSAAIILMMVGIAVLKRQLNQQQKINKELQEKSQGGTARNGNSTEFLSSSNGVSNAGYQ